MNPTEILTQVAAPYLKKAILKFRPGDTLRVFVKVVEGESERIQPFEGIVLKRRGSGVAESFTVRKISFGIGVERTFPIHSPRIEKIELIKSGRVRRAKLFYLRKLSGKAARLTEKENKEIEHVESAASDQKPLPNAAAEIKTKDSPEPVVSH